MYKSYDNNSTATVISKILPRKLYGVRQQADQQQCQWGGTPKMWNYTCTLCLLTFKLTKGKMELMSMHTPIYVFPLAAFEQTDIIWLNFIQCATRSHFTSVLFSFPTIMNTVSRQICDSICRWHKHNNYKSYSLKI